MHYHCDVCDNCFCTDSSLRHAATECYRHSLNTCEVSIYRNYTVVEVLVKCCEPAGDVCEHMFQAHRFAEFHVPE
jgi:hypothetical protein